MRNKQFDLIRLIAALLVVISHSFDLLNKRTLEPFYIFTEGRFIFSDIGIYSFFILSGYLICHSFNQSNSVLEFLWKRFLRIYPALFIVVILTIVIIGPLLTKDTVKEFFNNRDTKLYFINASLIQMHYELPGLFKNNPVTYVNGSLWTLQYEGILYLIVSTQAFFLFKNYKKIFSSILFLFCLLLWLSQINILIPLIRISTDKFGLFGALFSIGMMVQNFGIQLYINKIPWAFLLILFIFSSMHFPIGVFIFLALPLILFKISMGKETVLNRVTKFGDVSYGLYIYAFLIQQIIISYISKSIIIVLILSIICAWVAGFISWKFVELPALKLKNSLPG